MLSPSCICVADTGEPLMAVDEPDGNHVGDSYRCNPPILVLLAVCQDDFPKIERSHEKRDLQ